MKEERNKKVTFASVVSAACEKAARDGTHEIRMDDLVRNTPQGLIGSIVYEDMLDSHLRSRYGSCLNQQDYLTIESGVYYDIKNGTDAQKKQSAIDRRKRDIKIRCSALVKHRKDAGIKGQLRIEMDEITGELTIVEDFEYTAF